MEKAVPKIIIVDFEDSFTLNIAHTLWTINPKLDIEVVPHSLLWNLDITPEDLIILGPGPYEPTRLPEAIRWLREAAPPLKVFGLCLGMQLMCAAELDPASALKAVIPMQNPRHGQAIELVVEPHEIFFDLSRPITMIVYNSWVTSNWTDEWHIIARDRDEQPMAVVHSERRHLAVQFHPESAGSAERFVFFRNLLRFYDMPLT